MPLHSLVINVSWWIHVVMGSCSDGKAFGQLLTGAYLLVDIQVSRFRWDAGIMVLVLESLSCALRVE